MKTLAKANRMSEIIRKGAEKVIWIQESQSWLCVHFWSPLLCDGIMRLEEFKEQQGQPKASVLLLEEQLSRTALHGLGRRLFRRGSDAHLQNSRCCVKEQMGLTIYCWLRGIKWSYQEPGASPSLGSLRTPVLYARKTLTCWTLPKNIGCFKLAWI